MLALLDVFLTPHQRQLPPGVLGRYRVLLGATGLLLVVNVLFLLGAPAYRSAYQPIHLAQGVFALVGYAVVLVLVRKGASPTPPALVLCSVLTLAYVIACFAVREAIMVSHATSMLLPMLAVYLLGARLGFIFAAILAFNAAVLQVLQRSDSGLELAFVSDPRIWKPKVAAGICVLLGWGLSWLYSTAREEAHTALEQAHTALEQAMMTLRESQGQLVSVFESTDDLVLSLDREGRLVTANRVLKMLFQQLLGREPQRGEPLLDMAPPSIKQDLQQRLERTLEGKRSRAEVAIPIGGKLRTLDITLSPVLGQGDRVMGATLFSRDITDRKEAEARLSELHRSLLDVSRQAGMAEVATGVLHNVGNALNSVNVSANLVFDRLQGLRLSGLSRATELLSANASRLGTFLTKDEQGRQLPAYLQTLSSQLTQEQQELLAELRSLRASVEHIKSVVSMQQQHARFSGVVEQVTVSELIDDALRLHAVSFERLGIQLRREYAEVPPVLVDRHRLLQILVNLLSNARHALLESTHGDKQLSIHVKQSGERLRIAVEDNGMGIAPENLARMFTQGFTTKKDGHGFGLHISALAAEEMGGCLTCTSEGLGQGATFTLELPTQPPP
ncbi:ATP-binding protein [Archangium sp.]|uniref:two-component system sensor histidine kinase NtrB n=1 Tax=Archangium sp. TaxID=1872627 RepID=UPI00286A5310|nr:ATP-binding protein [Archangium sp.]